MAHEERNTLAMLKGRKGETLAQLLTRLDLAIAGAQTDALALWDGVRSEGRLQCHDASNTTGGMGFPAQREEAADHP